MSPPTTVPGSCEEPHVEAVVAARGVQSREQARPGRGLAGFELALFERGQRGRVADEQRQAARRLAGIVTGIVTVSLAPR